MNIARIAELGSPVNRIGRPMKTRTGAVVELLKDAGASPKINTFFSAVAAFGVVITLLAVLIGWLATGTTNQVDLRNLRGQMEDLNRTVSRISDQMASGLRPDDVNRHLSSQDGRMDAIDTRMRNDEERLTRALTMLEEIDASSRATAAQIRKTQP